MTYWPSAILDDAPEAVDNGVAGDPRGPGVFATEAQKQPYPSWTGWRPLATHFTDPSVASFDTIKTYTP